MIDWIKDNYNNIYNIVVVILLLFLMVDMLYDKFVVSYPDLYTYTGKVVGTTQEVEGGLLWIGTKYVAALDNGYSCEISATQYVTLKKGDEHTCVLKKVKTK